MTFIFNIVLEQCVLKFCFSVITFSLVNRFTSYSHTMLLWTRPSHWYATLWPSNGRVCIVLGNICVEKLGEKYKNLALMWDPHFLLVLSIISLKFRWKQVLHVQVYFATLICITTCITVQSLHLYSQIV